MINPGKQIIVTALIITAFTTTTPAALAKGDSAALLSLKATSQAFSEVAEKAIPAIVYLEVSKTTTVYDPHNKEQLYEYFFGSPYETPHRGQKEGRKREREVVGHGSGFIFSDDGYIMTNHHVAGDADQITVTLNNGRQVDASLVGTDPKTDIAVIKIDPVNITPITLGNSDQLKLAEWVIAIGAPYGLTASVTSGIVSALGRHRIGGMSTTHYQNFIQTDAAINPGNSGGPLINLDGEVVGINTAIFSQSGGNMGIGFAIPINLAKKITTQLIAHGKVTRAQLGIHIDQFDSKLAQYYDLTDTHGAIVVDVLEDSPAEKAGLKHNDIIVAIDGRALKNDEDLRRTVSLTPPGTDVVLSIYRKKIKKEVTVTLAELSDNPTVKKNKIETNTLGFTIDNIKKTNYPDYDGSIEGVLITKVKAGSPAEKEGLAPGMIIKEVNEITVNSEADFNKALKTNKEDVLLFVTFKYHKRSIERYIVLKRK